MIVEKTHGGLEVTEVGRVQLADLLVSDVALHDKSVEFISVGALVKAEQ